MRENITKAVTGATGHIGEALVRQLLEESGEVRAIIRKSPGALPERAKRVSGDLRDPKSLTEAFRGCEEVYNLAAISHWPVTQMDKFGKPVSGALEIAWPRPGDETTSSL